VQIALCITIVRDMARAPPPPRHAHATKAGELAQILQHTKLRTALCVHALLAKLGLIFPQLQTQRTHRQNAPTKEHATEHQGSVLASKGLQEMLVRGLVVPLQTQMSVLATDAA